MADNVNPTMDELGTEWWIAGENSLPAGLSQWIPQAPLYRMQDISPTLSGMPGLTEAVLASPRAPNFAAADDTWSPYLDTLRFHY